MEIDRLNFPWVFSRGDKSSRLIATLESLAVLLALKAFCPTGHDEVRRNIRRQPTWELAVHCKHAGVVPLVSWAPRLCNREADDLANGRTEVFTPALEVKLEPDKLQWHVLWFKRQMIHTEPPKRWERGIKMRKRKPEERLVDRSLVTLVRWTGKKVVGTQLPLLFLPVHPSRHHFGTHEVGLSVGTY